MKEASLMQALSAGQMVDLFREMGKYVTPDEARQLLTHRHIWGAMAKAMRNQYPFDGTKLVHGMFTKSWHVRDAAIERLKLSGCNYERLEWVGMKIPPQYTDDVNECAVLVITLDTLLETMHFLWCWAADQCYAQTNVLHIPEFGPERLRYVDRSHVFQPLTIRWVRLRVAAGRPDRNGQPAGPEVLALAAQHPMWIRRERSGYGPYFRMAALEAYDPGRDDWGFNPALCYGAQRDSLTLQAWAKADRDDSDTISPVIIG